MAFLDLDGDGLFTMVEPHQGYDSATLMAVHADASGANYSLLPTSAVARVSTSYSPGASSYGLSLNVTPNLSLPARVILCSGPNVPTPSEIGIQADGDLRFGGWVSLPPGAVPVDGDAYRFKVILSDGTVQIYDAKIAGILAAGITLVSPQGNVQSTTPTFTWTTTGTLPEVYAQDLYVYSSNTSQWELSQLDPSVRSVKYNSEGSASPSALALNTGYFWHVRIQDSQGNTIESDDAAFTPVP